jgi:hypothetical protein
MLFSELAAFPECRLSPMKKAATSEPTCQRCVEVPAESTDPNFLYAEMKIKLRGILWERRNPRGEEKREGGESGGDKWTRGKAENKSEPANQSQYPHTTLSIGPHTSPPPTKTKKPLQLCKNTSIPSPRKKYSRNILLGEKKEEIGQISPNLCPCTCSEETIPIQPISTVPGNPSSS